MSARERRALARPHPLGALSAAEARRLALAAQGLARHPPAAMRASRRTLRSTLERLGAIQIDSINVVARSHELTLAARTGASPELFERVVYRDRAGFEYWGHAASFLPIDTYRLFLPRMRRMAASTRGWWAEIRERHGPLYEPVLARIRAEGPLPASAFREPGGPRRGTWWDWAPAKHVLEDLFDQGTLLVHDRVRFERRYDLAERVLPAGLDVSVPSAHEAAVELTVRAAGALGVATAGDLADYFRLRGDEARAALAEAVGSGLLAPVAVQGWKEPGYVLPRVSVPRATRYPPVLLAPFDSLIWSRARTERLFGFQYRLEVYVPAPKRRFGYYTMPVLAGGRLVARVDPKLDRARGRLLVRALHTEGGDPGEVAGVVAEAVWRLAGQLGAGEAAVDGLVDLPLERALREVQGRRTPSGSSDTAGAAGLTIEARG